jgi:hemolysin-activating ACP:hemolysin acyltransferase
MGQKIMEEIINLYKSFSKYQNYTYEELQQHIEPSIKLNQYKIFKQNNKVIAFSNWAFFDKESENKFLKTKEIENYMWNSGNIVLINDVLSLGKGTEMANWLRKKFKKFMWLRSDNNWNFYRIGKRGY